MRKLKIDDTTRFLLREAFKRDVPYEPEPTLFYLDLSTGDVTWVYERDEDADHVTGDSAEKNREARVFLQSQPDRFVLILGLSHGDHHAILLEFLSSDCTDDEELRTAVRDAYSGSIGRWKRAVEEIDYQIVYDWYNYRDDRIDEMIEEFLRKHGFEPEYMD